MRHGQDLGWRITLNGVTISGGDFPGVACLTLPPEGLGLPELRTEDVTFPQRDGVRHFADWYEPRIITLEATVGAGSCCRGCGEERARVREILKAWSRECDDTELVVHPPCPPHPLDRTLTGPYGVVGRPRVAEVTWRRGKRGIADLLLRFDGVDHRMYILDEDGTPGSGEQCVTLTPDSEGLARCYDRCYTTGRTPGEPDTLLRTNLHPNPFLGDDGAGWTADGRDDITQTVETESGPTIGGRTVAWLGLSFEEGDGTPVVHTNDDTPSFPVTGDEPLEVSVYVQTPGVETQLGIETDDGTVWGEEFFPGEGWTQLTDTLTAPTGATEGRLLVRFAEEGVNPGVLFGVTGALVGATGGPFDGDNPSTSGTYYNWTGDPYQSPAEEWELGGGGEGGSYCYDTEIGDSDGGPTPVTVIGDTCVSPTITLHGPLTYPTVQNLTTGETIRYRDVITDSDSPVIIDTADGTATQGGASRTHLLDGNVRMVLDEGENLLRLISFQSSDNGYAEICFRPIVIGA